MWCEFSKDLEIALIEHNHIPLQYRTIPPQKYTTLHHNVNIFYKTYVKPIQKDPIQSSGYSAWFEPFVMNWLNDNDDIAMEIMHNAYEKDKQSNFVPNSELVLFSSSVVDIFSQLDACYNVIRTLECSNQDVQNRYLRRYSLSITKILLAYANTIRREFTQFTHDTKVLFLYKLYL